MSHTSGKIVAKASAVRLSSPRNTMSQNLKELLYSKKVISTGVWRTTFTQMLTGFTFWMSWNWNRKLGVGLGVEAESVINRGYILYIIIYISIRVSWTADYCAPCFPLPTGPGHSVDTAGASPRCEVIWHPVCFLDCSARLWGHTA